MFNRVSARSSLCVPYTVGLAMSLVALLGLSGACSSGGGDDSTDENRGGTAGGGGDGSTPTAGTAGDSEPVELPGAVGNITVTLVAEDPSTSTTAHTSFLGIIRDGAPNELTNWVDGQNQGGGCKVLRPEVPFCDPECGEGTACVGTGQCRAEPTSHSVGTMTVTGLSTQAGASEFTIDPMAPKYNYQPGASVRLAYPPATEGTEIKVATAGGDYDPFEVKSSGIAPLEVTSATPIAMNRGQNLTVTWTPKGSGGQSSIEVLVDISHHGGAKGKIVCTVEDNGSLSIPSSQVDELLDLGKAGFPTVKLSRVARGSVDIAPGRVDLEVYSHVETPLEIEGLISCQNNSECPDGQSCGSTRSCEPG